jgi:hypothetical protein
MKSLNSWSVTSSFGVFQFQLNNQCYFWIQIVIKYLDNADKGWHDSKRMTSMWYFLAKFYIWSYCFLKGQYCHDSYPHTVCKHAFRAIMPQWMCSLCYCVSIPTNVGRMLYKCMFFKACPASTTLVWMMYLGTKVMWWNCGNVSFDLVTLNLKFPFAMYLLNECRFLIVFCGDNVCRQRCVACDTFVLNPQLPFHSVSPKRMQIFVLHNVCRQRCVAIRVYQLLKYFLTLPSPERIFLSILDTAYQITLGSQSSLPGPIFSMRGPDESNQLNSRGLLSGKYK